MSLLNIYNQYKVSNLFKTLFILYVFTETSIVCYIYILKFKWLPCVNVKSKKKRERTNIQYKFINIDPETEYTEINLIKNKIHNILIDEHIKRYIPSFALISQKIYQTETKEQITSNLKFEIITDGEAAQGEAALLSERGLVPLLRISSPRAGGCAAAEHSDMLSYGDVAPRRESDCCCHAVASAATERAKSEGNTWRETDFRFLGREGCSFIIYGNLIKPVCRHLILFQRLLLHSHPSHS